MATYTQKCSNNSSYTLRLELSESNISIASNTSVVTYSLYLDSTYPRFEDWNVTYTLKLGNEVNINTTKLMSMPPIRKQPLLLVSGSKTITHDSNGQKSLSVSCSISTPTTQSDLPGSASISNKNFTLATIARKSTLESTNGYISVNIATEANLKVTRQNNSFTHTITYTLGATSGTITTKSSSTTIKWSPGISLYMQMVGSSIKQGTITIETFNGATSLGSNSYPLRVSAYNGIVYNTPAVSAFNYTRGNGNSDNNWSEDPFGPDIKITYSLKITSGISGNTTQGNIKLGGTNLSTLSNVSTGTYSLYKSSVGTDTTFNLSMYLYDTIGYNNTWNLTIATVEVPFNINVELPGIACGKVAEYQNTFELKENWNLKLKGYNLADFIVEQGASGIWSYRKWYSGIAECWCTYTDENVSITTVWGSVYESSRRGGLSFPEGLFDSTPVSNIQVLHSPDGAIMSLEITGSDGGNARTPYWSYVRPNNTVTGATITVGVRSIGKWR